MAGAFEGGHLTLHLFSNSPWVEYKLHVDLGAAWLETNVVMIVQHTTKIVVPTRTLIARCLTSPASAVRRNWHSGNFMPRATRI